MLDIRDGKEFVMSYKNYINSEWIDSIGKLTFENVNPADMKDVIGNFQDSGESDINHEV